MNKTLRTILLFIAFIIFIAGIVFLLYFVFFRTPPKPAEVKPIEEPTLVTLPEAGGIGERRVIAPEAVIPSEGIPLEEERPADLIARGGRTALRQISEKSFNFSSIRASKGDIITYQFADGKFVKVPLDGGESAVLSDRFFPKVTKVTWAPDGEQAIIGFPDEAKIYYNFKTQKQYTIPKQWEDISFSSDSHNIAFKIMNENPDKRWLAVGSPDGSDVQLVEPLGREAEKFTLAWSPNNQIVGLFTRPKGIERQEVLLVSRYGANIKSMYAEGFGLVPKWSPNGDRLLYSVYPLNLDQGIRPELWIVDAAVDTVGQNRIPLGVQTWADKCAFEDSEHVLCAVPRVLPRGSGAYRELANPSPDDFYRIDTRTGLKTFVAQPEREVRAIDLQVVDGNRLVFIDAFTNNSIELRLR